jgi:hypothetical protein
MRIFRAEVWHLALQVGGVSSDGERRRLELSWVMVRAILGSRKGDCLP